VAALPPEAPAAADPGTAGLALPGVEDGLREELQIWQAQASELEQHLEQLARLQEAYGLTGGPGPQPRGGGTRAAPDPGPHQHLGELEDLRLAVEEFLTALEDLPDPD